MDHYLVGHRRSAVLGVMVLASQPAVLRWARAHLNVIAFTILSVFVAGASWQIEELIQGRADDQTRVSIEICHRDARTRQDLVDFVATLTAGVPMPPNPTPEQVAANERSNLTRAQIRSTMGTTVGPAPCADGFLPPPRPVPTSTTPATNPPTTHG